MLLDYQREFFRMRAVDKLQRETIMSHHNTESEYTPEEMEENSRVDAMAIFSIVVVCLGLVIFYVAS